MPRPRKSTRDELLDQFADFPIDVQESLLDQFALIHRQAKRRGEKPERPKELQQKQVTFSDI